MEEPVSKTAAVVDVFNARANNQKASNPPSQRLESSYCTCAHSGRNTGEKQDIDPEMAWASEGATHSSITRSTYLTSFGRLSAEKGGNSSDLADLTPSQPSGDWWTDETETSIDGGSDKLSAGIDERLAHVWQKTTNAYFKDAGGLSDRPEGSVFVSRLKRSPAMILSGIKDELDSSNAEVAPSISSSADAFKTTLSKGVPSSSQSDNRGNVKKYLNDQLSLSQSGSGDMGRRKLPSVPPTFDRCQFVPADQPQTSWQYNKQLIALPGTSKGSSSRKYGELVDRSQPKLNSMGKRALPPTLARVLLKQELKEVLLKRAERLEASEIEANQREFVVTRYLATGIYPKSVGIDSAPRVVQCGLPLEMVKGCTIKLNERTPATCDKLHTDTNTVEKSELQRHREILDRIVEIERMTKQACKRMDISVGTSDALNGATHSNSTTQTYSRPILKDAQTQTLLETDVNTEKKLTQIEPLSAGADSQWKSVAVGTSDAEAYKVAATDTQELEPTSARFPENVLFSGSRKFRDLHSKAFALFSAEDDSASREYRKSRIRGEIARRRGNFNSCEDLTFSMREPYFDEMGYRRQSLLGHYRPSGPYTSTLPRYSSLPRIDLLYDGPPRSQTYFERMPERSFVYPYSGPVPRLPRNLEGYPQRSDYVLDDDRGGALANEPARQSYLSLSLPYLDSVHNIGLTCEPYSCSHSWRDDLVSSTQQSGRSLLSHYANYLNNDFLSRPSAVNDYYRSADSPIDYSLSQPYFMKSNADQLPSTAYAPGQASQASLSALTNTVCGHLPSRYDRYMEPIESVPPSALCPSSDFDRKTQWQTPAPTLFDPELMETEFNAEVSRPKSGGPLVEPYFRQSRVAQRPKHSDFPGDFEGRYGYKTSRSFTEPSIFSGSYHNIEVAQHFENHRRNGDRPVTWINGRLKRLLLVRDQKDRSGHGLGMRVIGGKILPGSDSELVTYVAAVYKGGLVDLMGEVKEGDQILEWNGIQLNGKTYEEVQKVIDSTEGEVEILIKSGANLNQVYHLEDGQSTSLDKGYESDYVGSIVKRADVKLVSQNGTMEKRSDIDGGKASPCFSTTPRTQSPQGQQQTMQSSGSLQARVYFESSTGTLFVTIVGAKELPRLEKRRRPPNPFVKVYLLPKRRVENKRRTKFLPKTINPEWNQTVAYKDLTIEMLSAKALEFTVWSYERFRENIFLGRAVVQLSGEHSFSEVS
ncbi:protein vertebrate piccolo [Trichuris trichiura]|uniref:Protein vertebrate piccolo n=1 Tax=Trichuris trichiura TaxID=36087 RepID=A0A077Z3Q3_TRITR|nr:protein vertebrate piccolo [Trichuris trichiura]